jgi:predicted small lipoprotein YifL
MSRFLPLLLTSVLFTALAACGQKGALYLPDQQQPQDQDEPAKKAD